MIIEASNIHKSFGALEVLKGVDFSVDKGEVVAVVGASGAGKSTLLQILGTLSTPDSGSLLVDGTDVLRLSGKALSAFRNKKIGFVFQAHHLLPEFNAIENVMIPALIGGVSSRDARSKALSLLEAVGLSGRLEHKPSELSGGEQQRVAIARALVNSPAILFADEPTGNLDSRTKEDIHRLLFSLRESLGQTLVIVTHDPALAALCDRTCTMRDGMFV
jgi:lipoprotein-releasing system ATP-binding protein